MENLKTYNEFLNEGIFSKIKGNIKKAWNEYTGQDSDEIIPPKDLVSIFKRFDNIIHQGQAMNFYSWIFNIDNEVEIEPGIAMGVDYIPNFKGSEYIEIEPYYLKSMPYDRKRDFDYLQLIVMSKSFQKLMDYFLEEDFIVVDDDDRTITFIRK